MISPRLFVATVLCSTRIHRVDEMHKLAQDKRNVECVVRVDETRCGGSCEFILKPSVIRSRILHFFLLDTLALFPPICLSSSFDLLSCFRYL